MTAPNFNIQPLPVPQVAPTGFRPAPSTGDILLQGASALAKILMFKQDQELQRQTLAQQRELGLGQQDIARGQLGVQQDEQTRLRAKQQYDQQQAGVALERQRQTGQGLRAILTLPKEQGGAGLPAESINLMPDESIADMVENLEKMGAIAPLTARARDFAGFKQEFGPPTREEGLKLFGGGPGTEIRFDQGSKVFSEGFAREESQLHFKDLEASRNAIESFDRIERVVEDIPKAITGVASGARFTAARWANKLGLGFKNEVEATQVLKTDLAKTVSELITSGAAGRGNLNPRELEFLQEQAGNLTMEEGSIRRIYMLKYKADIAEDQARADRMRERAFEFPDKARRMNADADRIEQQLRPRRAKMAGWLEGEAKATRQAQTKDDMTKKREAEAFFGEKLP